MPVTLRNTDILFNNGTTQNTAAVAASTDFGGIGSYALLLNAANSNYGIGTAVAGSTLRYNYAVSGAIPPAGSWINSSSSYNAGGTSVAGTWRRMSSGFSTYTVDGDGFATWYSSLYVRIS